jgi:hypothetical protein
MGGLIRTKGTKKLVAHFNDEFDTWIDFYRPFAQLFDTSRAGYTNLLNITMTIRDNDRDHTTRGDKLTLLPDLHGNKHRNLEKRWKWFLDTANAGNDGLTPANDRAIAGFIHKALTDQVNGRPKYSSIEFDALEHAGVQTIVQTDLDDGGVIISQIHLKTNRAMPTGPVQGNDPPPIDP